MVAVSQCVICDGALRILKKALVAPFLAKRIWSRKPFCVSLVQCRSCGFIFYNPRLDNADLQKLYANYRSDEYRAMRHATEPWYTRKFNADLASSQSYVTRRARLAPILKEHLGDRKIARILDHGGDHGDLVVGLVEGAEAYVYDISGVDPAPGVIAVKDPQSCKADLIINSNVLEHIGFPRNLVEDIFRAAPEGGLVFLEVPCEFATGPSRILRRVAQILIMAGYRPSLAKHVLQPGAFYMMHEHINFYTEQSLVELVRQSGGKVRSSGSYAASGRAGRADMAWCLAEKAKLNA